MPHLDEAQLTALLDDELTAPETEEVEAHLASCAECRQLLAETREFFQEAGALIDVVQLPALAPSRAIAPVPPDTPAVIPDRRMTERRQRGRLTAWSSLGWAASLVLAVGLGWFASDLRYGTSLRAPAADVKALNPDQAVLTAPSGEFIAPVPGESALRTPAVVAAATEKAAAPLRDAAEAQRPTSPAAAAPAPAVGALTNQAAPLDQLGERRESSSEDRGRSAAAGNEPRLDRTNSGVSRRQAAEPAGAVPLTEVDTRRDRASVTFVTLEEAVRSLGGTIRLVDGMVPARVETRESGGTGGNTIRVVYLDPPGRELWLDQERPPASGGPLTRELEGRPALLVGDTLAVPGPGGKWTLSWMDQAGLRLGLTGFLPADSLHGLVRRIH
ncbi:MAG: zf-HC2 domain-containing protein [Gemmatimonadales bacterium]